MLLFCIIGIYTSFLLWSLLQEQLTSETTISPSPIFINLIQSLSSTCLAIIYLKLKKCSIKSILNRNFIKQLLPIALTQSLSSSLGLSSVKYINYIIYTLAKSCKLIPVMLIHKVYYRRVFPLYKYVIVGVITTGVVIFSIAKGSKSSSSSHGVYDYTIGISLLLTSLLLDGVTNSSQDVLFKENPQFKSYHLMFGLNLLTVGLSIIYSIITNDLINSIQLVVRSPIILRNLFIYGIVGSIGQIFIFITLEKYGSIVLITVTVTRKMLSMILSVVWFGHDLNNAQILGISLVFLGIGYESLVKYRTTKQKAS